MASHSDKIIAEIIPLMRAARDNAGQWLGFTVDDPRAYASAMRWVVHNPHSPVTTEFAHYKANSVVIEWKYSDGWDKKNPCTGDFNAPSYTGRVRLRVPRTNTEDTK